MAFSYAPYVQRPLLQNPKNLRRWRTALADADTNPAYVHVFGHSIVHGVGIDGTANAVAEATADVQSFTGRLRTRFARQFGGTEGGMLWPRNVAADSRVVCDTSASATAGVCTFSRGLTSTSGSNGVPGSIAFTPTVPFTTFEVIYYEHDGSSVGGVAGYPTTGAFAYAVDGASAVTVAHGNGVNAYKVLKVTGLANTTHTIALKGTSANTAYICGFRYHSGSGVVVGRLGQPGWTVADSFGAGLGSGAFSPAAQARLQAGYGMGSPHLAVIMWDINDWQNQATTGQMTTVSAFKANLQIMCNTMIAAGGCALLCASTDAPYGNPAGGQAGLRDYQAAMAAVSDATDHVAFALMADVWGPRDGSDGYGSSAAAMAAGLQNIGSVHPTRAGHSDFGSALHRLLTTRDPPLAA